MRLIGLGLCAIAILGQSVSKTDRVKPISRPPIQYFAERCERCHGVLGENFGGTFAQKRSPEELIAVVKMMANGPGGEPLTGTSFDAQVALHRAIQRHQPFIVWTKQNGRVLGGEATPGSTLTATENSKPIKVEFKGTHWKISMRTANPSKVQLKAKMGTSVTTLALATASFSHSK
ncbi:MAG: hypothetical protein JNM04_03575 [Chthonomonas sp.]|nr:hypothetical protein [Chthonomonas sp.]